MDNHDSVRTVRAEYSWYGDTWKETVIVDGEVELNREKHITPDFDPFGD